MYMERESGDLSEEELWDYGDEDNSSSGEEELWRRSTRKPPKVTLSSLTEAKREESTIPVLKQQSYTGREVIPSSLANTLCADLGVDGVLKQLNTTLGTSHALDKSVILVLCYYVAQSFDFGTAYAYCRPHCDWYIPTIEHLLYEEEADRKRRNVLVDGKITNRLVLPRRVWDLYANRVVPFWVLSHRRPWGISHAWVDEKDRMDVWTPINGNEWPVPMPKDANLDLIRIEMLNLKAEYAWLDVLCLRQKFCEEDLRKEALRLEEWKLDVPTIGGVYDAVNVMCYFSGLGLPLDLTSDYFESRRCWFRRAWTLQETTDNLTIAGVTRDRMEKGIRRRFDEQLSSLRIMIKYGSSLELVSQMQHRAWANPTDRVAGLVYLLVHTVSIPIYDPAQSAGDAWDVLVDAMDTQRQAELFFFYPEPGNGRNYWRPSWEQVMTANFAAGHFSQYPAYVKPTEDPDVVLFEGTGYYIESGNVRGLSEVPKELKPRQGELILNDATGAPHTLEIVANHAYPIPDDFYTIIGCSGWGGRPDVWAIGQLTQDGKFKKLSVFRSAWKYVLTPVDLGLGKQVKSLLC